ncbi:hypothetical protein ACROYT_G003318 [Oculina patagonica]
MVSMRPADITSKICRNLPAILQVFTMKGNILVIFFLSLQFSPSTSASFKGVLEKVTSVFAKPTNVVFGTYSRSATVAALSRLLRGEDSAKVKESLNQAISTLALLDVGGGVLVPGVQIMVDAIAKETAFQATRRAFKTYNGKMLGQLNRNSWSKLKSAEMKRITQSTKAENIVNIFRRCGKTIKTQQDTKTHQQGEEFVPREICSSGVRPLVRYSRRWNQLMGLRYNNQRL